MFIASAFITLAAAANAAVTSVAMAENGWAADYVNQCCYTTLEAGQVSPPQWFDARNIGSHSWQPSGSIVTRLGTAAPHDHASAFFSSGHWIGSNRATVIDRVVPPGQTGRFDFQVKAPASPGTYDEHFAPVADGLGGGWMDGQAQWSNVFLTYTVKAPAPPVVEHLSITPRVLDPGQGVTFAVQASDNVAVDRITVGIGGRESTAAAPYEAPYASATQFGTTGMLDTEGLGAGEHTVVAQVVDKLGQVDVATGEVVIKAKQQSSGGDQRRPRGVSQFITWFKFYAKQGDGLRIVQRIALLPAPASSTGSVVCRRGCSLTETSRTAHHGKVVFAGGQLSHGLQINPGALIESRLTKGEKGRYKLYDARLNLRRSGCLRRQDNVFVRARCRR